MTSDIDSFYFRHNTEELSHIFDYRPSECKGEEICELEWYPSDTKDLFFTNYNKSNLNSDELNTLSYYLKNPIKYLVNSNCFRDESLQNKPKEVDVFLGCSFTFGIGIHLENTWVSKVSRHTKFPYINAGLPGSGPLTHYRVLLYLSKKFKIRNVYHLHDIEHVRYEWFQDLKHPTYVEWTPTLSTHKKFNIEMERILSHDRNISLLHHLIHNAIKGFCSSTGINYFYLNNLSKPKFIFNNWALKKKFLFDDSSNVLARDLRHPSTKEHHFIFLYFLFIMREKLVE